MRLIDADAIFPNGVFYVNESNPMTSLDELINRINNAPTVNAVVLPCKLGDPVFIIGGKYRCGRFDRWINTGNFRLTDLEKISKTVFLTREEAEAALAKMDRKDDT